MQSCYLGRNALVHLTLNLEGAPHIKEVCLSDNPGLVGTLYSSGALKTADTNLPEFAQFCSMLPTTLQHLSLENTGLGPSGAATLFRRDTDDGPFLDKFAPDAVSLDKNPIFGSLQ